MLRSLRKQHEVGIVCWTKGLEEKLLANVSAIAEEKKVQNRSYWTRMEEKNFIWVTVVHSWVLCFQWVHNSAIERKKKATEVQFVKACSSYSMGWVLSGYRCRKEHYCMFTTDYRNETFIMDSAFFIKALQTLCWIDG